MFWGVCIPVRLYLAWAGVPRWAAAALGLWWLTGMQTNKVGFFGGRAWWAEQRWMHGAIWLAYALSGDRAFLYLDAAFGAINRVLRSP